jgi:hypothetical protein
MERGLPDRLALLVRRTFAAPMFAFPFGEPKRIVARRAAECKELAAFADGARVEPRTKWKGGLSV